MNDQPIERSRPIPAPPMNLNVSPGGYLADPRSASVRATMPPEAALQDQRVLAATPAQPVQRPAVPASMPTLEPVAPEPASEKPELKMINVVFFKNEYGKNLMVSDGGASDGQNMPLFASASPEALGAMVAAWARKLMGQ